MRVVNRTNFAFGPLIGQVNFPSHTATLVVKGAFKLNPGGVCESTEEPAEFVGDELSKAGTPECLYDADFAYFKPHADLLLSGTAYTPGGKPQTMTQVTFRVGNWSKSIACIGNRTWDKGLIRSKMSEPEEFTKVPLTWANAFGGPKLAANPAGKGHKSPLLPNLEDPNDLIGGAGDKPRPMCFGPVHRTWKSRTKKMGSYDKKWLKERWPAFPADFDWTHFNAAPQDQQLEGFLRGDEEIELTNLHPGHPKLTTKLPGLRARVLLRERDDATPASRSVREIPMNLDTLFVDADKGEVYLVWRGVADIRDCDWLECDDVLVVSEALGAETPEEELKALFDEEGEESEPEEGEEPETPEQRQARVDAMMKQFADGEARADQYEAQVRQQIKDSLDADEAIDFEAAISQARNAKPDDAARAIEAFGGLIAEEQLGLPKGMKSSDFNPMLDPDVQELRSMKSAMKPPGETSQIVAMMKSGEAAGGEFEEADLKEQDLSGADLKGANLARADLSGARLVGADLSEANLTGADLSGADLTDATLCSADLSEGVLDGANCGGANFQSAMLGKASAGEADFSNAKLNDAECPGLKAAGAKFTGADLAMTTFTGSELAGCDFRDATLSGANFDSVKAAGAKFDGATMTNFRGNAGADFTGATFVGAEAEDSVWEQSILKEADFKDARLARALFPFCDLSGARLTGANLAGTMLRRAKLIEARAGEANFFQTTMEMADLTGASLVAANCFEADMREAITEGTDLTGANLKQTLLAK